MEKKVEINIGNRFFTWIENNGNDFNFELNLNFIKANGEEYF